MESRIRSAVEQYFRFFMGRYYVGITLLSLMLTALGIWIIAAKWNVNSDFKALLPSTSAAAQAMEEVGGRVGSGSSLFVVIDSPDQEANRRFAEQYAERLRELPEVALAHFHNDKAFFEKHRLLYLDVDDLETLHERIRKRIRDEKRKSNPLFVSLGEPKKKASDDLVETADLQEKYSDLAHQDYKEYLVSDDGYSLTIVVRFVETSTDLEATNRLLTKVRKVGEELRPRDFHPEMTLELGGGLVKREQEYRSIVDDIQTSAIFTIVGLFLVIALYFRRLRAVAIVLTPLVMGVVWTLALAFAAFGELTTVTVFIFAILLGLGIDFSIHLLSGYDHERREGHEPIDALIRCFNSVGRATVIGAVTTFATFVVLSFAQFRGLSQFGQVASLGVACTLAAMVLVLPALILTLHRLVPHNPGEKRLVATVFKLDRWFHERTLGRVAPVFLATAVLFTGVALVFMGDMSFEENFRKVGKIEVPWKKDAREPAEVARQATARQGQVAAWKIKQMAVAVRAEAEPESYEPDRKQLTTGAKYTSALSGKQSSTPTILLVDDADAAERVYRHLMEAQREGTLETVRSLASIYAFLPGTVEEQRERLEVIEEIRETLDGEKLSRLKASEREKLEEFRELLDVDPITVRELPEWTKRLFKEAGAKARPAAEGEEFAYEYLIYVNEAIDHMIGDEARRFLGEVQAVTAETGVEVRIGSQSYIYIAMLDEIKEDGARMLGWALVIVLGLLTLFFRSPVRAAMALLPLSVGAVWMFGFCAWLGIKLDFFNVIILPVIIGIGVDDGVHFYHRYLEQGRGSLLAVIGQVGSAIGMTTVTSMIGFGGLAVTHYAGLQSIGYLAIVGIGASFLATILVMAPVLWLAERRDWRWLLPER